MGQQDESGFDTVMARSSAMVAVVAAVAVGVAEGLNGETRLHAAWYVVIVGLPLASTALFAIRYVGYTYMGWSLTDSDGVRIDADGLQPSVAKTLYRECEAMAEYALSSGHEVPPGVLETIARLAPHFPRPMVEVSMTSAEAPPPAEQGDVRALAVAHAQLTRLVAPATPRTLRLLSLGSANRVLPFLGRIRLVRHFEYMAAILLGVFIAAAFKADFTTTSEALQGTGASRFYNAVYLLAAAGLGACFFGLYKANRYIIRGTYDPKFEPTYWIRFTLGIVAGVVLALVVPIGEVSGGSANSDDFASSVVFTKPLLALLGGFSAEVVYRILNRLVDTLEALVQGRSEDVIAAQAEVIASREALRVTQARTELSAELIRLEAALETGLTNDDARTRIRGMLDQLLPTTSTGSGG